MKAYEITKDQRQNSLANLGIVFLCNSTKLQFNSQTGMVAVKDLGSNNSVRRSAEPGFYGELVIKVRKIFRKTDSSEKFKMIVKFLPKDRLQHGYFVAN